YAYCYIYSIVFFIVLYYFFFFFFSSRRRHTRLQGDWSSDVCSSDLKPTRKAPSAGSGQTPWLYIINLFRYWQSRNFNLRDLWNRLQCQYITVWLRNAHLILERADRKSVV